MTGQEGASVVREQRLVRAFVELADTLVSGFDVVEFMSMLAARSVDLLDLAAAGVLLDDQRGQLRVVAASDEKVRLLELLELQHDGGPCTEAFHRGVAVQVGAAEALRRWPRFATQAAGLGYQVMCALPLRLRDQTVGALNLFRATTQPLDAVDLGVGQALADVATIGLLQERSMRESRLLAEQLQVALNSRVALEQAKGVLAEQTGLSIDQAFEVLRRFARQHNLRLVDVARRVVSGELSGSGIAGL
ncbi:MAG TPA: GAF and ANTAR domain-containing protein [Mycobacteriales bacterium]|nr:GAF and ANTAR domain-containing protein [Mycobacteriales bacterium]